VHKDIPLPQPSDFTIFNIKAQHLATAITTVYGHQGLCIVFDSCVTLFEISDVGTTPTIQAIMEVVEKEAVETLSQRSMPIKLT
jgi:hypothetical protein